MRTTSKAPSMTTTTPTTAMMMIFSRVIRPSDDTVGVGLVIGVGAVGK